jgi:hypothetical protein
MRFAPFFLLPLIGLAPAALAQTVTLSAIPAEAIVLNIEEIEDPDFIIQLDWVATVDFTTTYQYEISYDEVRNVETSTVVLVRLDSTLDAGEATGTVVSGQAQRIRIRPKQIIDPSEWPDGPNPSDKDMRAIYVRVFRDFNNTADANWLFKFDSKRPPPPTIGAVLEGENRLVVSWTRPDPIGDITTFDVVYCPSVAVTASVATSSTSLPCANPTVARNISNTQSTFSIEEGLTNDVMAAVAVRSVDEYGNIGTLSEVIYGVPTEVSDFFERYKEKGGAEDGGFCFIATAATGSYTHPAVRVLRWFRDGVLKQTPLGTFGVWSYYRLSPPFADQIARHPVLASAVRLALVPITLLALLVLLAPFFAIGILIWRTVSWKRSLAMFLPFALFAFAQEAEADPRPKSALHSLGIGIELKGGPYLPAIAGEPIGLGAQGVFADVFRETAADAPDGVAPDANALYSIGIDMQLFRGFGTAGIGGSFGFMQFVGRAFYANSDERSADTTVFNLMPLSLTAFYRFDYLADAANIPFVPYLRGGLAYHLWWVTNGVGDVARYRGSDPNSGDDDLVARGGKFGFTGTVGMSFLLNVLEPDAALALFDSTSIRGTYLFAEYQVNKVDGFGGEGFDFSDSTWNLGLYLEL